jgi:quercetin dioxygenase-like cupin family protein
VETYSADTRSITAYDSEGVQMMRCVRSEAVSVHVATFAPGGVLGRHPAARRQAFTVVSGAGWVAGPDGRHRAMSAGDGALWEPGEEHESGSDTGMCAVIVEA